MSIPGTRPGRVRSPPISSAHPLISWCSRRSGGMRRRISEVIQSNGKSFERNTAMGFFSAIFGDPDAVEKYKDADDKLARIAKRDRGESEAWHKANDDMWEAREDVPWWRR